jgi:kinesin family protein 2/24
VKEVERLKKNREDRRAKQQEMLEEKAHSDNTNTANFDFLCMIQEYQEQLEYNPLTEDESYPNDHQVRKAVLVCSLFRSTNQFYFSRSLCA